jgi:hypothetical protein
MDYSGDFRVTVCMTPKRQHFLQGPVEDYGIMLALIAVRNPSDEKLLLGLVLRSKGQRALTHVPKTAICLAL